MAAQTQLSPTATPGRRYSFTAKTAAGMTGPKGAGTFTELSPMALPGQRHSFTAKTAAAGAGPKGAGNFTALSPMALPGKRYAFTAKTAAAVIRVIGGGGSAGGMQHRDLRLMQDDEELMELAAEIVMSGILDE